MQADIVFNTVKDSSQKLYQIASGHISTTTVFFEEEELYSVIEAKGKVSFYGKNGALLAQDTLPPMSGGRELYKEVRFEKKDGKLILSFPDYEWIDNYPNCDGESDRWDTVIVGYFTLCFELSIGRFVNN